MKIYSLPVQAEFQPSKQNYRSPTHGRDWGVIQDFHQWLQTSEHLVSSQHEADWDYLPIFWNRLFINWNWGKDGIDKIQQEISRLVSRDRPTFTICQYDINYMQPFFDLCDMVMFIASRQDKKNCIDIPLLCSEHKYESRPPKKYLASFVGNVEIDGHRVQMNNRFVDRRDIYIEQANHGPKYFVDLMLQSRVALAPRGFGGSSFRFFEAMQLGVVPYMIGNIDVRPFKRWIDWDACSFFSVETVEVENRFEDKKVLARLDDMSQRAKQVWYEQLRYGKWCKYVIKELEQL